MKIAIDCRLIGQSGIGTFIENVVYHMVERTDLEFVLIGNKEHLAAYAERTNCHIVECNYGSFTLKELFCFPTKEVNRCDAFFTPYLNIPLNIKVPIFSTIHDVVFFDVKGMCSPLGKMIRWSYIKRALKLSTIVFTVSQFSKTRIEEIFEPKCPIIVSYSGISKDLVKFKKTLQPDSIKKKEQMVFLGNLKKQKGLSILLEAFEKYRKDKIANMKLVIIGNLDFKTKDHKVIEFLKQNHDDIEFIRNASNQEVFDIIAESKVLISPSLYEGLGLPPMEAMYLGTQVIISDIPVYKEIYSDTNATFFETGDADDLYEKIMNLKPKLAFLGNIIEKKHNFTTISNVILENIETSIK